MKQSGWSFLPGLIEWHPPSRERKQLVSGSLMRVLAVFILLIILTSCENISVLLPTATPTSEPMPLVIKHPRPNLEANIEGFLNAGCKRDGAYRLSCSEDSPLSQLGCDYLEYEDLLGGLTPSLPLAYCISHNFEPPDKEAFEERRISEHITLVVLVDGDFRYLSQVSDLREIYAPIETPEEALSYALARTDFSAVFDYGLDSSVQYLVDKIEETHVTETEEGFFVHLFGGWFQSPGCGTHTNWTADVLVTRAGKITFKNNTAYSEFNGCVD